MKLVRPLISYSEFISYFQCNLQFSLNSQTGIINFSVFNIQLAIGTFVIHIITHFRRPSRQNFLRIFISYSYNANRNCNLQSLSRPKLMVYVKPLPEFSTQITIAEIKTEYLASPNVNTVATQLKSISKCVFYIRLDKKHLKHINDDYLV